MSNQSINTWAQQTLVHPLIIRPLRPNKIAQKVAGVFLLLIALLIVVACISNFIGELNKGNDPSWGSLVVAIAIILFGVWYYLFIRKRKGSIVVKIDAGGITTAGNSFYKWGDLEFIGLYQAYKKYDINNERKYISVRFRFKNGYAYVNHNMPDFAMVLNVALLIPANKKDIVTNAYYY